MSDLTPKSITHQQLEELRSLSQNGQRTLFYLKYYELTGSQESLMLAKVSSFSGFFGGTAERANKNLESNPNYPKEGVIWFSEQVQKSVLKVIEDSYSSGKGGLINDREMASAANKPWKEYGLGDYSPVNFEEARLAAKELDLASAKNKIKNENPDLKDDLNPGTKVAVSAGASQGLDLSEKFFTGEKLEYGKTEKDFDLTSGDYKSMLTNDMAVFYIVDMKTGAAVFVDGTGATKVGKNTYIVEGESELQISIKYNIPIDKVIENTPIDQFDTATGQVKKFTILIDNVENQKLDSSSNTDKIAGISGEDKGKTQDTCNPNDKFTEGTAANDIYRQKVQTKVKQLFVDKLKSNSQVYKKMQDEFVEKLIEEKRKQDEAFQNIELEIERKLENLKKESLKGYNDDIEKVMNALKSIPGASQKILSEYTVAMEKSRLKGDKFLSDSIRVESQKLRQYYSNIKDTREKGFWDKSLSIYMQQVEEIDKCIKDITENIRGLLDKDEKEIAEKLADIVLNNEDFKDDSGYQEIMSKLFPAPSYIKQLSNMGISHDLIMKNMMRHNSNLAQFADHYLKSKGSSESIDSFSIGSYVNYAEKVSEARAYLAGRPQWEITITMKTGIYAGKDITHLVKNLKQFSMPVGIELQENKVIELIKYENSMVCFNYNDDESCLKTSWVGSSDAILTYDHNDNRKVDFAKEIVLTKWEERAKTDLDALKLSFDSNKDGVLNKLDEEYDKFYIWQDKNQDGIAQEDELRTLNEAGIKEISLNIEDVDKEFAKEYNAYSKVKVYWENGAVTYAYDLIFEHSAED